jgi:cobalt-zinc-cadmium efflux system protein
MAHDHSHHHHSHNHSHSKGAHSFRILGMAIALIFIFAVIEAIGGWWTKSLALLGDAGHMGSDGIALSIALLAGWLALKPPSFKHSYGLGRAEVIAGGFSSLFMLVISLVVIVTAIHRLHTPQKVEGGPVIIIALAGLIVNLIVAWLLARGERTLNIRAALLHVMSDILGSISALISGVVIYFIHWMMIDPILSILIGILILISSLSLIRESLLIVMEGVPGHIDLKNVSKQLEQINGVKAIHDLHIWTLSSGKIAMSAHVSIYDSTSWPAILAEMRQLLQNQYQIGHVTLQPEPDIIDCQPCKEP